jgi:hypothetical protein
MIGCLKASHAVCDGAGEGAFLVAEEFALEQAFGDSRAIQADEWAAAPAAELVNQVCEQFFACPSLAVQTHIQDQARQRITMTDRLQKLLR